MGKWRGVAYTQFINHGEWADPEILYKGRYLSEPDVEDNLYEEYKAYCRDEDRPAVPSEYEAWVASLGSRYLRDWLDDYIFILEGGSW